jgi:hypothetical protein
MMLTNFKICSNGLNKSVKKLSSGSEKEECCKNGERRKSTYGHRHCQSAFKTLSICLKGLHESAERLDLLLSFSMSDQLP